MKVMFTTSECVPFAKTGGLADVAGALPKELTKKKIETVIVMPKYKKIDDKKIKIKPLIKNIAVPVGDKLEFSNIWSCMLDNEIPVYFIENDKYFARDGLYRDSAGMDYPDNAERFIFFSRACLETAKAINFQPDIIHCQDWQTGLIPVYLKTLYSIDGFFYKTATVYTVHNIAYQGLFHKDFVSLAGFSWHDFTPDKLEYYGQINFLKSGLIYTDIINTVSPTYAKEIQSSNEFGRGMEGVLRSRSDDVYGIINGIDLDEWNPLKDSAIPYKFSAKSLDGKQKCKSALCKEVGWAESETPLIGMVSRLDPLKGFDLLAQTVHSLMQEDFRLIILGLGDQIYQDALSLISQQYPNKAGLHLKFDNDLAHRIYASSDMFLMPSRFEPCGLAQMISMRYGTIPIVHSTGGLADSVKHFDMQTGKGNGFVFNEYSPTAFQDIIREAISCYKNKPVWKKVVANAFATDFSWTQSAKEYIKLYKLAQKQQMRED